MRKTLLECLLAFICGVVGTGLGLFLRELAPANDVSSAIAMGVGQIPALVAFLKIKSRFLLSKGGV